MPLFDYRCETCGLNQLDVLVGPHERVFCAACSREMTKLAAAPSFTVTGFNAKTRYSDPRNTYGDPNAGKER